MQGLPLQVEDAGQFFVAAIGFLDLVGELPLGRLDHLLLAAQLLALLFGGVLAFVEQAFPLVEVLPHFGQLAFPLGLLLDGHFLDFQLGLFAAVGAFTVGPGDDLTGLGFGVPAAQPINQLGDQEREHHADSDRQGSLQRTDHE